MLAGLPFFKKEEKEKNERWMSSHSSAHPLLLSQTECSGSVDSPIMAPGGRMRTKPLIPEACFTIITEEDAESDQHPPTPHLHDDGTSLLISCSQCSVRVHTSQCRGHVSVALPYLSGKLLPMTHNEERCIAAGLPV